jgi:hypothetical protein
MIRIDHWPRLAFVYLPLLIVAVASTLLLREQLQPATDKAIRLVRESNSRKENFTVQQYLYSTVFYRKRQGEPVEIEGWRATVPPDANEAIVEFSYSDAGGRHVATWQADVKTGQTTPLDGAARELSWH